MELYQTNTAHRQNHGSPGYYLLTIRPTQLGTLLSNNNERAFVLSQLQDNLSPRILPEPQQLPHQQLSAHIDLLAFSVLKEAIQLLVFSISDASPQVLASLIISRLAHYRDEWPQSSHALTTNQPAISLRKLAGAHEALDTSLQLHLNHQDWESDRYSSIGFFLHDRRGDWMRLWRLSGLYENATQNYYNLLSGAAATYKLHFASSSRH